MLESRLNIFRDKRNFAIDKKTADRLFKALGGNLKSATAVLRSNSSELLFGDRLLLAEYKSADFHRLDTRSYQRLN